MKVNLTSYEFIINKYKNLVYKLARRLDYGKASFDDLVQAGFMGLLYACNKFDFTRNSDFISYASKYIISEMKKENGKSTPYKVSDYLLKLKSKVDKLNNLSLQEISQLIGTSVDNVMLAKSLDSEIVEFNEELYLSPKLKFIELELNKEELQVYKLRIVNKYSQKEISKILNVSQPTVSRMIKRIENKISQEGLYN